MKMLKIILLEEMQIRWSNYLMFNVLEYKGDTISFSVYISIVII